MAQKFTNLKQKILKFVATPLCLGNISINTGFNGYVCDFSVDYDGTDVDDIVDIHKYLMEKKQFK